MTMDFTPRLEILPPPQRRLWDELVAVPAEFALYGGTALALYLGHRQSVDFDFFTSNSLDREVLRRELSFLPSSVIRQDSRNTYEAGICSDRWELPRSLGDSHPQVHQS